MPVRGHEAVGVSKANLFCLGWGFHLSREVKTVTIFSRARSVLLKLRMFRFQSSLEYW